MQNALLAYNVNPNPVETRGETMARHQALIAGKQRNALMQMQMQAAQEQQAQQRQQNALMQQFRDSIPSPQMAASQQALMGGGGPTVANAQRIQPVDPRLQMLHGAMKAGAVSPMDYAKEAFPKDEFVSVAPGTVRVNARTNQPVFTAPTAPKEDEFVARLRAAGIDPASQQGRALIMDKLRKDTTHAPAATAISYGSPVPVVGADGKINYAQPGNRPGAAPQIMAGPDGKPLVKPGEEGKPLTEGQAKAVAFASRMESADKVMAELSRKGVLTTIPGGMGNNVAGSAITAMSPAEQQQLMQAKRNFINAVLRRESGAVISADEFANAERQYFPQIGDSRPVIEQKARERRVAIEGMRADVPAARQGEVDRISGGKDTSDPLGIRGGK
jgi:hypothetical protein